jgi:hypothetical protein
METSRVAIITIFFISFVVLLGFLNSAFKTDDVKLPDLGGKILFLIACMLAGMLVYFNNGLLSYIILCFFIFVFFV